MPPTFSAFAKSLSPPSRSALYSSVPLLIAAVVGADREFDESEMSTAVDVLLAATTELGEEFRWSPDAQAEFDQLCQNARAGGSAALWARLRTLREIVDAMPDDLATTYREFLASMCISLAESSGGFFFFGESINDAEAVRLRKIVTALDLPVHSSRHRGILGYASLPNGLRRTRPLSSAKAALSAMSAFRFLALGYAVLAILSGGVLFALRGPAMLAHPAPWVVLDGLEAHGASAILGLAFATAVIASTRVFVARFAWARGLERELRPFARGLRPRELATVTLLATVAEELLFRAIATPYLGVFIAAALFGLAHQLRGPSRWVWVLWAAIFGLGASSIYALTGSLAGPLLAHVLVNGVNLAFLRQGAPAPAPRPLGGLYEA